jgi:hypothetical protein
MGATIQTAAKVRGPLEARLGHQEFRRRQDRYFGERMRRCLPATVSQPIETSLYGSKRVKMARHAIEPAMPITVDGRVLYRIAEGLREADISRATYFRWVQAGRIADARFRDRNGRRLLTVEELNAIKQHSLEVVDTAVAKPPITFRARKD